MLSLVWAAIIGVIVGAIAKMLLPGKDPSGFFVTMGIGIAGSLLVTYAGRAIGLYADGEKAGFIFSVIGAIALLALWRIVQRNRAA